MKEIDLLLQKYEAGETSLAEEKLLRELLVKIESEKYDSDKRILETFTQLQSMQMINSSSFDKEFASKIRGGKVIALPRKRTMRLIAFSIAASAVITISFIGLSNDNEAYVVDKGVRYDDMEKAVGCANEAVGEAIAPLKQSMQSLEPISGLDGSLMPTYSDSNTTKVMHFVHDSMINPNY
jgi:hypothetical protein